VVAVCVCVCLERGCFVQCFLGVVVFVCVQIRNVCKYD